MQSRQELKVVPADYRLENSEPLDSKAGAAREKTSVASPRDTDIATIIEQLGVLSLRQAERDRSAQEQSGQQTALLMRMVEKLDGGKDKTTIPNWLMTILFALMFTAGGFVYNTVDRRISDNKVDVAQQNADSATELRILRTYVIQLTIEMNRRGLQVPPLPETKK